MRHPSIRQQILLMSLLPVVGVMALVGLYVYYNYVAELDLHFEQQATATSRLLALYASADLERGANDHLQELANGALEAPGVRAIRLLDSDGQVLAHAGPLMRSTAAGEQNQILKETPGDSRSSLMFVRRPIYPANTTSAQLVNSSPRGLQGWVEIEYHRNHYAIPKYQTFLGSSLAILSAIIIAFLTASQVGRRIHTRIGRLQQGVRALSQGFFDTHFHLDGEDEIQELAEDLNTMKGALNSTFHELKSNLERSNTDLRETLETLEIQHIELDMARREAVEASRMKSEFLANTSHEIRTPLNSIIGFTNILLKHETDTRKKNYLETVHHSAETLLAIINDILDFSKIEAGKLLLDEVPLNLRELAEEAISSLAPLANSKRISLAVFSDPDVPCSLIGDPLRIRQVLTNLLNNAIKFTPSGHVSCHIRLEEQSRGRAHLKIEIQDTGIGLSPEQQTSVFTAFNQADASTSREFGGTGLGLVIVKRLIEQMDGECGVVSSEGQGSNFWLTFSLPVDAHAQSPRPFQQLSGLRVALYERNDLCRDAMVALLESWGVLVQTFHDPQSLPLGSSPSDLILLGLGHGEDLPPNFDTLTSPALVLSPEPELLTSDQPLICLCKPSSHIRLYDLICQSLDTTTRSNGDVKLANSDFSAIRTLIVDDNNTNLQMLSLLLNELQVQPITAHSGQQAIELCQEQTFDLIFMDLQMPVLDGIETTRKIRREGKSVRAYIVALSAYPSPDDPGMLRQSGFDQFCSKPVSSEILHHICLRLAKNGAEASVEHHPVDIRRSIELSRDKPQLARQMLCMLLDSLKHSGLQIQEAIDQQNRDHLSHTIHQLCGACSYVAVPTLQRVADRLHRLLLQESDWNSLAAAAETIINAIEELQTWHNQHDLDVLFELEEH